MFNRSRELELVLAEHGRWIGKLRDATYSNEQRLCTLERRISMFEGHLVELIELWKKLDIELTKLKAELSRSSSKTT
ncbi:MAG: hypothetical protein NZ934_05130 [Hadesarchaea archaeon]|nr:hypothetical protein [Hadesarchaea archaeon]